MARSYHEARAKAIKRFNRWKNAEILARLASLHRLRTGRNRHTPNRYEREMHAKRTRYWDAVKAYHGYRGTLVRFERHR